MKRLFPHPLLSLLLLLIWLVLTRFSVGNLVLGLVIAWFAGKSMASLTPDTPKVRNWGLLLRLLGIMVVDIARSNAAVAWLILSGGRKRQSGFVEIPLDLRDPTALALLAITITATPGTAWLEHDTARGTLLLHVFDLVEEAHWIELVKTRYERLLLEIFV